MKRDSSPKIWVPEPTGTIAPPAQAAEVAALKRAFYSKFDLMSFHRKRKKFWELDFSNPELDIIEAISTVIRSNHRQPVTSLLPYMWHEFPAGTLLWRARRMNVVNVQNSKITDSDLWEPPKAFVSHGRFNLKNDPLLYTCIGLPIDTLTEARIHDPDTRFMLIAYEISEPIRLRGIGRAIDPTLTARQQRIEKELSEFMAETMSIPAESDEAVVYALTQKILEHYWLFGISGVDRFWCRAC
ncbi:hypothetical protein [Micrococcoides hystricis]|uniref:Uncharacterized protein n=1 Tax=Micrococcoides hystricis TaxID=1572761 RepID=A0ABV6P9L8_9MICC